MFNNSQPTGSVVAPVAPQPFGPGRPGTAPANQTPTNSPAGPQKKSKAPIILGILLVLTLILAGVFIWLFVWSRLDYNKVKTDIDGQIDVAVAMAVSENTTELENEFADREKYPYRTFAGPADYGNLTFEYPKTWSVYIAQEAQSAGSSFQAYLNPVEVYAPSVDRINALRVTIETKSFDEAARSFEQSIRDGKLNLEVRQIGNTSANIYSGELSSNKRGIITIFRIRDKVVTLQTDAELFANDYYNVLNSITFIE